MYGKKKLKRGPRPKAVEPMTMKITIILKQYLFGITVGCYYEVHCLLHSQYILNSQIFHECKIIITSKLLP
jgi:hypothetical protein